MEYSLGNNQYPRSMTSATDVLSDHRWDKQHGKQVKKRSQQRSETRQKYDNDKSKGRIESIIMYILSVASDLKVV